MHTMLLEPHRCDAEWAVMPEGLTKGTGAKARKEEFELGAIGKEVLTSDEHISLLAIRDAVYADEYAGAFLGMKGNKIEESFFWKDAGTGYEMRCRPDFLTSNGILGDVKTTASIKAHKFTKSFFDYGYHRQSAIYGDGILDNLGKAPEQTIYIAIQGDEAPEILVQCFAVPAHVIATGRSHYRQALTQMRTIEDNYGADTSKWPRRLCDDILTIEQPAYIS